MGWWQDLITQAFNPPAEPGVDVGTPFHTPITALAAGTVVSETHGGFGQRIDIATGGGVKEYYQHLDTIAQGIKVGSHVSVGELLGLSGGQLSGGSSPNDPRNSSGPHVEFGIIGPGGTPMDPTAALKAGPAGGAGRGTGNPFQAFLDALGNVTGSAAGKASAAGGLINVDVNLNPFQGLGSGLGAFAGTSTAWAQANIIPLVVAGLIILVVLGASDKAPAPSPPQIIPVPV